MADLVPEADLVPVWLLRADISVWRTRFFWRLVASFEKQLRGVGSDGSEVVPPFAP